MDRFDSSYSYRRTAGSSTRNTLTLGSALSAACGLMLAVAQPAAALTSFCIDKTSPSSAMDQRLAQAVAKDQGANASVYSFDGSGGGDDDGFDSKQFKTLASESCALVLGYPVNASSTTALPPGVKATSSYAETGFVLVTPRKHNADTLADLPKGTDVAVTSQTLPNIYFASHSNIQADIYPTDAQTMKVLFTHRDNAAMIWRATAASAISSSKKSSEFCMHALNEPHARWNIVALYTPQGEAAATAFQKSVENLRKTGKLAALLEPYAAAPTSPIQLAAAETPAPAAPAGGASPALYTAAQADEGKKLYADNCAQCHGDNMEGMAGPALKGKFFASPKANFHVGDIFTIVSQNMPATNPGSLPKDTYVSIMAFILQQNGMPAGSTALTFDGAKSSTVPLIYKGN